MSLTAYALHKWHCSHGQGWRGQLTSLLHASNESTRVAYSKISMTV